MGITEHTENGKHYAEVGTAYRTPDYLTARMALADAECWNAFNKGAKMDDVVTAGEEFEAPMIERRMLYSAAFVSARIAEARRFGVEVSVRTTTDGREYIALHRGGSQYSMFIRAGRPDLSGMSVTAIPSPDLPGAYSLTDRATGFHLGAVVEPEGEAFTLRTTAGEVKGLASVDAAAETFHASRAA